MVAQLKHVYEGWIKYQKTPLRLLDIVLSFSFRTPPGGRSVSHVDGKKLN